MSTIEFLAYKHGLKFSDVWGSNIVDINDGLTPGEILFYVSAQISAFEDKKALNAWHAWHLIAVHAGEEFVKKYTPMDLLYGKQEQKVKPVKVPEKMVNSYGPGWYEKRLEEAKKKAERSKPMTTADKYLRGRA